MNALPKREHADWIEKLAIGFRNRGFEVLISPDASQLPFDMFHYTPDLIARKDDTGVIIEVRTRQTATSPSRLFDMGEEVAEHRGWRFMYANVEDIDEREIIFELRELPSWADINAMFAQLDALVAQQASEAALLYAWRICEAALRRIAMEDNLPLEQMPTLDLLTCLYTFGEIPLQHFEALKAALRTRDRIARGFSVAVNATQLQAFLEAIKVTTSQYLAYREEKRLRHIWQAHAQA